MIAALSDGSDTRELSQQLLAANSTSSGSSCEASFHLITLLLHVDMPHVGASASAIPDKSPLALLKSPSQAPPPPHPAPLPSSIHDKSPRSFVYLHSLLFGFAVSRAEISACIAGGKKVWSAVGAVLGIASPVIAIVVFLLIFNTYRLEKKMLVKQVMKNMRAPDICAPSVVTIPTANPILLRSSSSLHNSGQLLLGDNPFSGIVPGHPSRRRGVFGDPSVYDPDDPGTTGAAAAEEVQRVGKEITLRCLQRWDGFMGFRASTDSLGRQSGIWREKFDGVRIASLLLAFRKLNASLGYNQPGNTGWHMSCLLTSHV